MALHPGTKIALWLALVVASQRASPSLLLFILATLAGALAPVGYGALLRLIARMRYVFVALVLIYGYATAGHAFINALGHLSPTREGLAAGGMQILRLTTAFAGLGLLLGYTAKHEMLAGILALLRPFGRLGLNVERIAVRLALTLHYAESPEKRSFRDLTQELRSPTVPPEAIETVRIPTFAVDYRDIIALTIALVGLVLVFR